MSDAANDRESKTLAEATADELLEELRARCSTHVYCVVLHVEPGRRRTSVGGDRLLCSGMSQHLWQRTARALDEEPVD